MGKGSGRRPTDDKKFVDNYDRIFSKKKDGLTKEKEDGNITNPAYAKKVKG